MFCSFHSSIPLVSKSSRSSKAAATRFRLEERADRLIVQTTKQPCTSIVLERFHAAQQWMIRTVAGAIHAVQILSIALSPWNSCGQTRVMGRARRAEIRAEKTLGDQSIATHRIAGAAWSPWRTSARTTSMDRSYRDSSQYKYHKECKSNCFHHSHLVGTASKSVLRVVV